MPANKETLDISAPRKEMSCGDSSKGVRAHAQAALLYALQTGLLQGAGAASVRQRLSMYLQALRAAHPRVLRTIAATGELPAGATDVFRGTLEAACAAFSGP